MPQDRLSMRKIRDVLRYRHSTDLSLEAIARACFCQFKIDQARQLNFDQGLKPVF